MIETIYETATDLLSYIEHADIRNMVDEDTYSELYKLALRNFELIAQVAGDEQ